MPIKSRKDGLRIDEIIMITNSIGRLDHTSIRRWKIKSNFPPKYPIAPPIRIPTM